MSYYKSNCEIWCVVLFTEENTLAVIPNNWIFECGKKCYWQPYKTEKVAKAAQKRTKLCKESWNEYEIEESINEAETYLLAREKLKLRQDNSDVENAYADTLDKNLRHDRHINVPSSADNSNDDSMQQNADEPLAIIPLIPPTEEGGHENTRSDSSSSSFESSLSGVKGDTEMEKENDIFTPPISIDQTPSISTSAAPTLSASKSTAPTFSASTSSGHVNSREKTSVETLLEEILLHQAQMKFDLNSRRNRGKND
ncbi:hypothetical protein TKK_0015446 [Trichogramma kaykai]